MKTTLQLILLTAISLSLLSPSSSAISSTIEIAESMQPDQELEVVVTAPDKGDYDIKLFFEYQESIVPSEVLTSQGWENSHYYIQDINFEEKTFNIRLQNPSDSLSPLSLCIRLRKADSTSTPQKQCVSIEVTSQSSKKDSEKQETVLSPVISRPVETNSTKTTAIQTNYTNDETLDSSPIRLSSNKSENKTVYTSEGKSKIIINYLIAFVVLITLFIVVRSEIKHREI